MYGSSSGTGNLLFSASILEKVTYVSFLYSQNFLKDIEFGHPGGSSTRICGCDATNCPNNVTKSVAGNLVGMAVTNTFSSVNVVGGNSLSIWDDIGGIQCTQPVTSIAWVNEISN